MFKIFFNKLVLVIFLDVLLVFIGFIGSDDFCGGVEVWFIILENKLVFDKV